ncbi:hypothetical protein [Brevibacillus sp. SYSU BS000544]|uniref:hypothetical protein n=1 Tax=Brevibacillus sp. SYSU BS000544 TaxID=3416443 RepID=UPI003CE507D2
MKIARGNWNRRLLTILEQTYPTDARLMAMKTEEGEQQNQAYAERLSAYRKMIERNGATNHEENPNRT